MKVGAAIFGAAFAMVLALLLTRNQFVILLSGAAASRWCWVNYNKGLFISGCAGVTAGSVFSLAWFLTRHFMGGGGGTSH